ncbi:MAG: saccharopine dehydrogenase C-terminal domain-containing protein [Anaerolineales bacterium]|nr:saccharopine dehydrogenase C-terminal domain-containing protein [Anaerolineales bacterium]
MSPRYAVIGSGRQGTAAAYDLIQHGDAELVILADMDLRQSEAAAERVNRLTESDRAHAVRLDVRQLEHIVDLLRQERVDAFVSAVPYTHNLTLTEAAIRSGCGMTDLGGNSDVVLEQLQRSAGAADAGATVVPDCGQVPGMGTSLILYAMEALDEAQDVRMWDCGLPQEAEPPWNYRLTFHIEGLTNEYYGDCLFIRDGELTAVPALAEYERLSFPEPIGELEAFTTAGGLTTAARTYEGQLRTLQNKTLRYPGNFEQLKVIEQLGLLNPDPISVNGLQVSPREVLHTLWEPQIRAEPGTPDFILIRIVAEGLKNDRSAAAIVDLVHRFDEETGFTAMEQATGWHAAIVTAAIAHGRVPVGVVPIERAMTGHAFVEQAKLRGFDVRRRIE